MLLSALRNLGLASIGEKSELDIILSEQREKFRKEKNILVCNVNLEDGSFAIETIDVDLDKVPLYLPGLVTGGSKNYSPLMKIQHQKKKIKDFTILKPEDVINLKKLPDFETFLNEFSDKPIIKSFSQWLEDNADKVVLTVIDIFKRDYLDEKSTNSSVVRKDAPKYMSFKINDEFIGEIDEFKALYMWQKNASRKTKKSSLNNDVACIACGQQKSDLIPLKDCKFFDFFSIDQVYYQMGFQSKPKQAMICSECEKLTREGYNVFNTQLQFLAYKIKVSRKESKQVWHSIIPLTSDISKIRKFIAKLDEYRDNYYKSKKTALKGKIEQFASTLEKASKDKKRELKNRLKKLKSQSTALDEAGILKGSNDIEVRKLLEYASQNDVGLIDFYYEIVTQAGNKKKVVIDFIYGEKQQIHKIVNWLKETDDDYPDVKFSFTWLYTIFGEKMAKIIIQSLFTEKKISQKDLFRAAYKHLWNLFKKYVLDKNRLLLYQVRTGSIMFHYTLTLLDKADLLR